MLSGCKIRAIASEVPLMKGIVTAVAGFAFVVLGCVQSLAHGGKLLLSSVTNLKFP